MIQYRVVFGKNDEAVDGPDDAEVVVTVAAADATLRPELAFMLRSEEHTSELQSH